MPEAGEASQPSPVDRLAGRLTVTSRSGQRALLMVLLFAVSIAATFVVSPSLYAPPIPTLTADDLGRPYAGSIPFKAARDYEIANKVLTEQRRQEARAAVRPVYDFNPSVLEDLKQSAVEAFASMQEIVAQSEEAQRAAHATEDAEKGKAKKKGAPPPVEDPELEDALHDARYDFEEKLLGRSDSAVESEDFQALVGARFGSELEKAAAVLLDRAYAAPIASSREELARDGAQGILLRDLRDLTEQVRLPVVPAVFDVHEAQVELDKLAMTPGAWLADKPAPVRRAVLRLVKRMLRPNLTVNTAETDARRRKAAEEVKEAVLSVKKGQRILAPAEAINETHLAIVHGIRAQTHEEETWQLELGSTGLIALLIGASYAFFRASFRRFRPTRKDAVLLALLLLAALGGLHLSVGVADAVNDRYDQVPVQGLYAAIPLAGAVMLVRFLLSQELATWFAIVLSSLAAMALGNSLPFGLYTLIVSFVSAQFVPRAKDRAGIIRAGGMAGLAGFATVTLLAMADGKIAQIDTWTSAALALAGTLLFAPAVVMAIMPIIEAGFGYASDLKLLELANLNHPALKELIVQAPGTYHHSIILGSLVENAAETIGANSLLARSCAYYHDIGKGRNPLYFGENQKSENRHDALAPAMSAVIIKRHVTEGLEMARQYRLPKLVADAIPQHHGTRLVGYFYHKAVKEQEGKENPQTVDEDQYRYPGPKPQFRESALVMIADAVEASCRSLSEPTTVKLQGQVQKIINLIFSEGQLDECDLTLKDLNRIAQSFLHTLEGIYHTRPVYPPGAIGGPRIGEPAKLAIAVGAEQRARG